MFARLTVYENVDLELADKMKEFIDDQPQSPFDGLPGYRGSMTLVDRDNARLVGIGFYSSAGAAEEADALSEAVFEQARDQVPGELRAGFEMQPESVGLYEIVHRD